MEQTMRWFGPRDPVSLADIRQAGCTGVVTALHHIPPGAVWELTEINKRKQEIEAAGMTWTVVESLPVSEDIKRRRGDYLQHIDHYQQSLRNLAACGLRVITYNFMPVLDWVRTDIAWALPDGAKALRFERLAFIAFDLFLLQRPGADRDYTAADVQAARQLLDGLPETAQQTLFNNCMLGLPGTMGRFSRAEILAALERYQGIDANRLRQHLVYFLKAIVPVAEAGGLVMAIHPDDPPFPVLGLPRIVSTRADLAALLEAVPSIANGLCYCTGSLGVRKDNHLVEIIQQYGAHIHFVHLRNTASDAAGNFHESYHLEGNVDMYAVVTELVALMQREGRRIPMRPDHGHLLLDDLQRTTYPGYSAIGRLKGLAELRGLEFAISKAFHNGS